MSIGGKVVGPDVLQTILLGDSSSAANYSSVLPIADATSLTGKMGLVTSSTHILENPGGTFDVARSAPGTIGIPSISTESTKATFSSASGSITLAATATDFWTLVGSGTKTVRLLRLVISGFATAAATREIYLIKRSVADTSGSATQPTIVPNDSNDPAATAVVNLYSANPTLGSVIGNLRVRELNLGPVGSAGIIEWSFSDKNDKAPVLRGVAQSFCLNFNGAAVPSGTSLCVEAEFTEE